MTGNSVRVGSGTAPAQVNRQAVSEVMHSLGRAAQRRPDDDPVQDLPLWEMAGAMEDRTSLPTATARTSLPTATAPGRCDLASVPELEEHHPTGPLTADPAPG